MNLFVGTMFKKFNEAWNKEKNIIFTNNKKAQKYCDYMKQIQDTKPEYNLFRKPDSKFRNYLLKLSKSKFFKLYEIIFIILNSLVLSLDYDSSSQNYKNFMNYISYICTSVYIINCFIRLIGNGIKIYFNYNWNKFEFIVSVFCILEIIFDRIDSIYNLYEQFLFFKILRVSRSLLIISLVINFKGLTRIFQTLTWSINSLSNVFKLMFLVFLIFGIMGCYVFDEIRFHKYKDRFKIINQYYNFDNFYNSFLLSFRQITGEAWPQIMREMAISK